MASNEGWHFPDSGGGQTYGVDGDSLKLHEWGDSD